jgi:hypothetical protein
VGVHPSRSGLGFKLTAASCGAANADAPVGMRPSRSGLGLSLNAVALRVRGPCGRASALRQPWIAAGRRGCARAWRVA